MDKLVRVTEFETPEWITDLGDHNRLPTPWREITEHEYWHLLMWVPLYTEFRQVKLDPDLPDHWSPLHNVHVTFYNGGYGLAVMPPQRWRCATDDERAADPSSGIIYTEPARYFRIGCEHARRETVPTGVYQLHRSRCLDCRFELEWDTSG